MQQRVEAAAALQVMMLSYSYVFEYVFSMYDTWCKSLSVHMYFLVIRSDLNTWSNRTCEASPFNLKCNNT